ncbi:MAG: hypothetical protein OXU45_07535 [Candidatus Melainabacteria bacterium]|nr:hypothetical protein [Candidatus Melainabacteria bacterium]
MTAFGATIILVPLDQIVINLRLIDSFQKKDKDLCTRYVARITNQHELSSLFDKVLLPALNRYSNPQIAQLIKEMVFAREDFDSIVDELSKHLQPGVVGNLKGRLYEISLAQSLLELVPHQIDALYMPQMRGNFDALKFDILLSLKRRSSAHVLVPLQIKFKEQGKNWDKIRFKSTSFSFLRHAVLRERLRRHGLIFKSSVNSDHGIVHEATKLARVSFAGLVGLNASSDRDLITTLNKSWGEYFMDMGPIILTKDLEQMTMFEFVDALFEQGKLEICSS